MQGDAALPDAKRGDLVTMFDHIGFDPAILGGKPCIKGTRISVEFLLELVAAGASREEILRAYPHLESEDIEQTIQLDRGSAPLIES
jgi:uncharacterized protein (DUF433 family)